MTTDQVIALSGVMAVGIIALLSLLGWVVTILMKIQSELARLSAEVSGIKGRLACIEQVVLKPPAIERLVKT